MKPFSLILFFLSIFSGSLFAQDIKDIGGKMSFPSNLPIPRFIISLPDSVNGISIVYEDMKSITAEKLAQLNKIELVELRFSNQFELDKEVELLANFPSIKYLVLHDWKYGSKLATDEIKLPKIISSFQNIVGIKFSGEWKMDYSQGMDIIKELPNLRYLLFQDFEQPIPDDVKVLKQLKGISFQSMNAVSFPEWITELENLESISLGMAGFSPKGSNHLNYYDALSKLQKLPLIKSLYLSYIYKSENAFDKLKFDNLEKIELYSVDFKSNKSFLNFLTNQKKLQSIRISASSLKTLDASFSKLKYVTELAITGTNDSLHVNFNLKDLTRLKSLKLSNVKLFLNQSEFPSNLVRLDLSSTHMKVFPSPVLKLRKLKALTFEYNSLMLLPDKVSDMKQLEYLNLSSNQLRKLPENFGNLRNLKTLNLSSNPMIELTESIGRLKKLKTLEIQHGNLKELPPTIGKLGNLQVLDLNDNFITKIPESIINIKTLKTLNLAHNQLIILPYGIGDMSALEDLNANFNNIKNLPKSMGRLQGIKKISLDFNDLDSLPEEISNLSSLQELYLNSGKINEAKGHNYARAIFRKDDPNPTKDITVNHIKNFPEDLSKWTSLKKLSLDNNNNINAEQLMRGLFTIPSKGYSLSLENCGISNLPNKGWESFLAKSLNLRSNQIEKIPNEIIKAPYLSEINVNRNKLKTLPNNLNQYVANQHEKALWFVDLGIISEKELPRTDSMVLALVNKSSNHYYRKEFQQAVKLVNTAIGINDSLAMSKIFLTNMGEANYEVGNYNTAIHYLTRAIKIDTAGMVRIMNVVIPDFEFRAKSFLKLGDTLSAIGDYETLAERFNDSWGEVGLLYQIIGKTNEANIAFEKGIKKYQNQVDYLKKTQQSAEMQQLSLLELMVIKEDFHRAIKYATDLEKEFKLIQHLTLLRFLKASAEIGNNSFEMKTKSELMDFIKLNKKTVSGWSYDLFFKWLKITRISEPKVKFIRDIANGISVKND